MSKNKNGGNREEVPLEKIVLSNMYSMEALIDILVENRQQRPSERAVFWWTGKILGLTRVPSFIVALW